jgi:hypothetical protein
MNKIDTTNINVAALIEVIDYLEDSERQSYEEFILNEFESRLGGGYENKELLFAKEFYDNPNVVHIYALAKRLKDSIMVQQA